MNLMKDLCPSPVYKQKKSSVGIFNFYNQVRISLNYQSRTSYHLVVTKYFGENINNYIPQN